MAPPDPTLPAPVPTRRPRLRWGIPDVAIIWALGFVAGSLAAGAVAGIVGSAAGTIADNTSVLVAAVAAQYGVMFGGVVWLTNRKGQHDLRADFGLVLHPSDWTWIPRGIALQIAVGIFVLPLQNLSKHHQGVVRDVQTSTGARLGFLTVTALIVAPIVEELLFRGVLLRALARRVSPVAAIAGSGLAFALVHLIDPSTLAIVPGLLVLGCVSATVALRSGDLSKSIFLHMGFNTLAILVALFS